MTEGTTEARAADVPSSEPGVSAPRDAGSAATGPARPRADAPGPPRLGIDAHDSGRIEAAPVDVTPISRRPQSKPTESSSRSRLLGRLDRLGRRLSLRYNCWRAATQWDRTAQKENEDTAPPADETVETTSLFVAEAYPPSECKALVNAIRRLGWDQGEDHPRSILRHLDAARSSVNGGFMYNLGPIARPGGRRFFGRPLEAALPDEVECASARMFGVTPSLSVLVVQFVLTERAALSVDRLLREPYRTSAVPSDDGALRILSPEYHKRQAVLTETRRLLRICEDWFRSQIPGAFSNEALRGDFPSTRLICTRKECLTDTAARRQPPWKNYANVMGFRSTYDLWKFPAFSGLHLCEPTDDLPRSFVLTGRTDALYAGLSSGYDHTRLALAQSIGDRMSDLVALWTVSCLINAYLAALGDVRDSARSLDGFELSSSLRYLTNAHRTLSRLEADARSVASEIADRDQRAIPLLHDIEAIIPLTE